MTLDEALAYPPDGVLGCDDWCDARSDCSQFGCSCGMEQAREVIVTLQAALRAAR